MKCECGNDVRVDKHGYVHSSCATCKRRRDRASRRARGLRRGPYSTRYYNARKRWIVGKRCAFCGTDEDMTVDHIVPLCLGGSLLDKRNWRPLCSPCHQAVTRRFDLFRVHGARRVLLMWGWLIAR